MGASTSAPRAVLPASFSPQLATLASEPPTVGDWGYEAKFDGSRILARIEKGACRLVTRNGNDWTSKMESLAREVAAIGIKSGWLDGEAVVMGDNGLPSFNALQNAFDRVGTEAIQLYLFDAPYLNGRDLRSLSLRDRRSILKEALASNTSQRIRFSDDFIASGATVLESACKMGLEGVMAKRQDAPYLNRRSDTWLKLKCHRRQEFVVGGFTDRSDGAKQIGSLLLGVYDDEGRLRAAGSVGTGWNTQASADLWLKLSALETKTSPFDASFKPTKGRWSRRALGSERWVRPLLVAEVTFAEWTPDGSVRHASFEGMREDKQALSIKREVATAVITPPQNGRSQTSKTPKAVKVSNADRVIDVSTGLTKLDLVRYYEGVAEWILPHLKDRPTALVRGPTGVGGELFFQKHGDKIGIPGIRELDPALWPGHKALLTIDTPQALAGAAQLNVIELHTWNSTAKSIGFPDRVIFDLDPGDGVEWSQIQEAAVLTRSMLEQLGLTAWLKTSGGKGLHVVVPLSPKADYDTVNSFSKAVVQHMAKVIPNRFVAVAGGGNRVGKIFIDYLRNGHGATTASAFSARSRPGLGVSMPVDWTELTNLTGGSQWTITTALDHLSTRSNDPWSGYSKSKQTLTEGMKALGLSSAKLARKAPPPGTT